MVMKWGKVGLRRQGMAVVSEVSAQLVSLWGHQLVGHDLEAGEGGARATVLRR